MEKIIKNEINYSFFSIFYIFRANRNAEKANNQ